MFTAKEFIETNKLPKPSNLNVSGIYAIYNTISQKIYIGSSNNIRKRWKYHRYQLKYDKHLNPHLRHSYRLYGKEAFEFYVISLVEVNNLIEEERKFVNLIHSSSLYNCSPVLDSRVERTEAAISASNKRKGVPVTEEVKKKISDAVKEKWATDEDYRLRCSAARKGIGHSEAAKVKMSITRKEMAKHVSAEEKIRWNNQLKEAVKKQQKIDKTVAAKIKALLLLDVPMTVIAKELQVGYTTVVSIKKNASWKEVEPHPITDELIQIATPTIEKKKAEEEKLKEILNMLKSDSYTYKEIGEKFGLSETTIWEIRKKFSLPARQKEVAILSL